MKRVLLVSFFAILLFSSAFAVIEERSMKVFAVTSDNERALSAGLSIQIKRGSGKIWSSVEPLIGTSTQTTEKIAVQVARNYSDKVNSYDYFFDINSTASLVDGPSAGAAMGLLLISMLQDKELPDNVSITGTITVDGSIGAVGGVFKKAQEAARVRMKLFMIPKGESRQIIKSPDGVQSINLTEYAKDEWGLTVIEVGGIDDALKYAFADIESIEVAPETTFTPDFVPEAIDVPDELQPMHALTTDYIQRAEIRVSEARSSLSGTLLTDPSLIDAMLSLLNQSEKTLEQSKLLYEQNYLYSAANYSFLALVNASLVKDISDNPSLLEGGSTAWDLKLLSLRKEVNALKRDLNRFVPLDYLEWHISAKERLSWAEEKLEKLEAQSEKIVITIGGSQETNTLEKIFDFEYASAWLEAAKDFHSITVESKKRIVSDSHFKNLLDSYIVNVENALNVLSEEEQEDIVRRLEAAKIARKNGWFVSSLFDAASALALANARIYVKNKSLQELEPYLKSKIASLEQSMNESSYSFVWARLYLDHAAYYSKAVDFYKGQNENSKAAEMAKSGISLVFLAENIFNVSSEAYAYFETIPAERYLAVGEQEPLPLLGMIYLLALLVFLSIAVIVLLVLLIRLSQRLRELKYSSLDEKIFEIRKMQDDLDKKWGQSKLSEEEYKQLEQRYNRKMEQLLDEKSEVSKLLVDLDRSKAMLFAFEHALRELKKRKKKRLLLKADYQKNFDYYNRQIAFLKKSIADKKSQLELTEKGETEKEQKPAPLQKLPAAPKAAAVQKSAAPKLQQKPKPAAKTAKPKGQPKQKKGAKKKVS